MLLDRGRVRRRAPTPPGGRRRARGRRRRGARPGPAGTPVPAPTGGDTAGGGPDRMMTRVLILNSLLPNANWHLITSLWRECGAEGGDVVAEVAQAHTLPMQ